jgi:hypothetical protein
MAFNEKKDNSNAPQKKAEFKKWELKRELRKAILFNLN